MENKSLFLIRDYDDGQIMECLLINANDAKKVEELISFYDTDLTEEDKEDYSIGIDGVLEFLVDNDIDFEKLDYLDYYY